MHSSVRQVISQVNLLLESARNNQTDRRTRSVVSEIENILRRNRRALHEIGVGINQEGFLTLDDYKLREAVANGTTDNLFRGHSGFLSSLSRVAERVSTNPTRHISPQANAHPQFRNILNQVRANTNQNAQQNQLQNQQQVLKSAADVNQLIANLLNGM
jgi:hypothetical protein